MKPQTWQLATVSWSIISKARAPPPARWAAAACRDLTRTCSSWMTSGQSSRPWLRSVLPPDLRRLSHILHILLSSQRSTKFSVLMISHRELNHWEIITRVQRVSRTSASASPPPQPRGLEEQLPAACGSSHYLAPAVGPERLMSVLLSKPQCPLLDRYYYYSSNSRSTTPARLCCSRCSTPSNLSPRCCWLKLQPPACRG